MIKISRFGTSKRTDITNASPQPGPGAYNTGLSFEDYNRGATMVARRPDTAIQKLARNPGPGAYEASNTVQRRSPSFRYALI